MCVMCLCAVIAPKVAILAYQYYFSKAIGLSVFQSIKAYYNHTTAVGLSTSIS